MSSGFSSNLSVAARARTVDEKPRRILAARQEHRGKAGPVAVESRAAAADEELPRAVVDAVNPGRFGLFMHERHIADRLLPVIGGARRRDAEEERKEGEDDPHHGPR